MADVKISALPAATTPLAGTEVLPIVQGGVTDQVTVANLTAGRTVAAATLNVDANSATAAVRITQTGAGNALVVEDSATPDATPFVVEANGRVLVGSSSIVNTAFFGAAFLQVNGDGNERSQLAISRFSADTDKPRLNFLKSRGASVGTNSIVSNGDVLGEINFLGADGSGATGYPIGASIYTVVDGTPGTNDMPGRLVFSTTADGASTPTERMRIDSSGNVGIGTSSPGAKLTVYGTGATAIRAQDATSFTEFYTNGGTGVLSNAGAGSLIFNNNGSERMRITNTGTIGIGNAGTTAATLGVAKTLTGATTAYGILATGQVQSDVTSIAYGVLSQSNTQATAFTLGEFRHFAAVQGTIGATSAITNQHGFYVANSLTGATNNYGFYSNIASGTGRWNFYAAGTAANYFAGDMQLDKTVTAAGTTGAQTINKNAGTVNFAAAATSLVVTNDRVTANSIVIATVATNDATMKSVIAVAGAGSFTLTANAAATAETRVNWLVIN